MWVTITPPMTAGYEVGGTTLSYGEIKDLKFKLLVVEQTLGPVFVVLII
jgi:hypothetical protein